MILSLSLLIALGSMAQGYQADRPMKRDSQRVRLSAEQKAQMLTDRMVKAYDLTAEQKTKLYNLNLAKLTPRKRNMAKYGDSTAWKSKAAQSGAYAKFDRHKGQNRHRAHRKGKGSYKAWSYYNALKEIMTPDQFKAYCTDKAVERQIIGSPRKDKSRFDAPKHRGCGNGMAPHFRHQSHHARSFKCQDCVGQHGKKCVSKCKKSKKCTKKCDKQKHCKKTKLCKACKKDKSQKMSKKHRKMYR